MKIYRGEYNGNYYKIVDGQVLTSFDKKHWIRSHYCLDLFNNGIDKGYISEVKNA